MPLLRLEAIVRADRHDALRAAAEAIRGAGGWIVGHHLFSDLVGVVDFTVPAGRADELQRRLAAAGLDVEAAPAAATGAGGTETLGQLRLTFIAGSGDLRHEVPAVP